MFLNWRGKEYEFIPRTLTAGKDKPREQDISANIYAFDTESSMIEGRYEPICFQTSSDMTGESLIWLKERADGIRAFFDYFVKTFSWIEFENRHCFMFAHNLMYDMAQLSKYRDDLLAIYRTGVGLDKDYDVFKTGEYFCVLRRQGLFTGNAPHFTFKIGISSREWVNVHFRDTFSFFPTSLESLGKTLKLPALKLERPVGLGQVDYRKLPEDNPDRVSFEVYGKRDPLTTRLAAEQIRGLHLDMGMQRLRVSAPGFAINSLYHMIPEGVQIVTGSYDESIMQLVLDAYAGGRTGGIYHGRVKDVTVLDFHSSYPASFVTLPSFTKTMEYMKHPDPESMTADDLIDVIDDYHCFVRVSGEETEGRYPALITNKKKKLTPVFGKFENLATTGVELSVGLKSGSIKLSKIHDLVVLIDTEEPECFPFKVFAETSYKAKEDAERDSPPYIAAKLRLNSSYGKLIESRTETPVADDVKNIVLPYVDGMETEFGKMYYAEYIKSLNGESEETFDDKIIQLCEDVFSNFEESEIKSADFGSLSLTKLSYGRYAIPAAAALTTGTSRARICAAMRATDALYWDTDSIFIHGFDPATINDRLAKGTPLLPKFIQGLKVGDRLGDMGIEIENASGYLAGTKRYYIDNDVHRSCPNNKTCCGKLRDECPNKKKCQYKKAIHGIPTAPYNEAADMIQLLATGQNNPYEGKARPLSVKEAKTREEIGMFKSRKYESQFHLDDRLQWEKTSDGWRGQVKPITKV